MWNHFKIFYWKMSDIYWYRYITQKKKPDCEYERSVQAKLPSFSILEKDFMILLINDLGVWLWKNPLSVCILMLRSGLMEFSRENIPQRLCILYSILIIHFYIHIECSIETQFSLSLTMGLLIKFMRKCIINNASIIFDQKSLKQTTIDGCFNNIKILFQQESQTSQI